MTTAKKGEKQHWHYSKQFILPPQQTTFFRQRQPRTTRKLQQQQCLHSGS